ncbi:MAG TPA: hypothetical protein VIU64_00440, partial [Polyangia bacterium]
ADGARLRVEAAARADAGGGAILESRAEVTFPVAGTVHPGQRVVAVLEWSARADPAARLELGAALAPAGSTRIEGWAVAAGAEAVGPDANRLAVRLVAPPAANGTAVVIRDVRLESAPPR